jgi:shikimate dehydrogenase
LFENYSGNTRIIPLLGHPVAQTKSPYGMTKGFATRGVDAMVVAVDVPPPAVGRFLDVLDAVENFGGVMATVPHKFALCAHASTVTDRAAFYGSANVMRRDASGQWFADMLDGLGFVRAVERAGGTIAGAEVWLMGAGGAGGAIALELVEAGAASVAVHDIDPARRDLLIGKLNARHPGRAVVGASAPAGHAIVVNATPVGMRAGDGAPFDPSRVDRSMFVGDVVTAQEDTPLIAAATAAGCRCCSGHDMFNASVDLMLDFFITGWR